MQSLAIFTDELHPSAMGLGKSKEGFSLFGMMATCVTPMVCAAFKTAGVISLDSFTPLDSTTPKTSWNRLCASLALGWEFKDPGRLGSLYYVSQFQIHVKLVLACCTLTCTSCRLCLRGSIQLQEKLCGFLQSIHDTLPHASTVGAMQHMVYQCPFRFS